MNDPIREGDRITFADSANETYVGIITDIRAGKVRGTTVVTLAAAQCAHRSKGGQKVIYATWDPVWRRNMYARICVDAEQIVNRTLQMVNGSFHIATSTGGHIDLHLFRGEGWRGCFADLVLVDEVGWNPRRSEQRSRIESSLSMCAANGGPILIRGGAA